MDQSSRPLKKSGTGHSGADQGRFLHSLVELMEVSRDGYQVFGEKDAPIRVFLRPANLSAISPGWSAPIPSRLSGTGLNLRPEQETTEI